MPTIVDVLIAKILLVCLKNKREPVQCRVLSNSVRIFRRAGK